MAKKATEPTSDAYPSAAHEPEIVESVEEPTLKLSELKAIKAKIDDLASAIDRIIKSKTEAKSKRKSSDERVGLGELKLSGKQLRKAKREDQ